MLKCDQPAKQPKVYVIPKVSKKRAAAIAGGSYQPKPKKPIVKKEYKIKPRSDKRAKEERIYLTKTAPELKAAYPICQRCNAAPGIECHHMKGRIAALLNNKKYIIVLCHNCHQWEQANPEAARAEGITILRTTK